jgi:hypothetical protein
MKSLFTHVLQRCRHIRIAQKCLKTDHKREKYRRKEGRINKWGVDRK